VGGLREDEALVQEAEDPVLEELHHDVRRTAERHGIAYSLVSVRAERKMAGARGVTSIRISFRRRNGIVHGGS
jgi:hypothetical protein